MVFLIVLWATMFIAIGVLLVLIVTTLVHGAPRLDLQLFTEYPSSNPEKAGARPAHPRFHLGDRHHRGAGYSAGCRGCRPAEGVRRQDQADQPRDRAATTPAAAWPPGSAASTVCGSASRSAPCSVCRTRTWSSPGATALSLLDPAGDHHRHPGGAAVGAGRDPRRITRPGCHPDADHVAPNPTLSGARYRHRRHPRPLPGPGRRLLRCCCSARWCSSATTRTGCCPATPPCPSRSSTGPALLQDEFRVLAAAASIVLLGMLLAMNGLAIYIRNRFQQRW